MFRLAAIAISFACACGPGRLETNPPPARPSDQPWVKEHRELASAGCACDSSSCLEEHKSRIAALEAEHGGLDESPAEVHIAHGEFEQCYQQGTRDPVRDLAAIAKRLCRCTTEVCVKQALIARGEFESKYGAVDDDSGELAELEDKYDRCKAELIVSGDELADHYERVMSTVCSCAANQQCGPRLTELPPMPGAVVVTQLAAHEPRIEQATERICNCALNAGLLGTYGGFAVTKRCEMPEK